MTAAPVIAERLTLIRRSQRLTRKDLHDKTGVSERTITRVENGEISSPRSVTINRLAKGLNIDPGVLIGDSPIPQELLRRPGVAEKNQFNMRISAAHRNAYALAARRYGVSTTKIAQLAPLLFVIVAEESLKYRREKLAALNKVLDRCDKLEAELSYLPTSGGEYLYDVTQAEKRSIGRRDLFGECLADIPEYDAHDNPFEVYLRAKARAALEHEVQQQFAAEVRASVLEAKPSAIEAEIAATIKNEASQDKGKELLIKIGERHASVHEVGRSAAEYQICRTEALDLVGGDLNAAESLISGRVTIDKRFRGMTPEERIAWMREHLAGEVDEVPPDNDVEDGWVAPHVSSEDFTI